MSDQFLKVALAQFNTRVHGRSYLPYSVALLQAYAQKHCHYRAHLSFLTPLYRRAEVEECAQYLAQADVIGFSTYIWSMELSLAVARAVKAIRSDIIIVFGGPQVPDHSKGFLEQNPQVDICVHGEGEVAFARLLDGLIQGDSENTWQSIFREEDQESGSLSFLTQDGTFHQQARLPRLRQLDDIPSPYLNGLFDRLMQANPQEQWLASWESNRGCPFSCTFCDWGSATGSKLARFSMDRLTGEIDWIAKHHISFVFCCDANFGILKRDLELADKLAQAKEEWGYPLEMSVQNTKNAADRAYYTQKRLYDAGLLQEVVLSLQSVDEATLVAIKRKNISLEAYQQLQERFSQAEVATYTDVVIGLPGETLDSFKNGVERIIKGGQHHRIKFYNLGILPNAEMAHPTYIKRHGLITATSRLINIQDAEEAQEDPVPEYQQLVVASHSMPAPHWVKARAFAWMVELLYFDKLLQMPLDMAHNFLALSYVGLFDAFGDSSSGMVLRIWQFFLQKAEAIQRGEAEHCAPETWISTWSTPSQYAKVSLVCSGSLSSFYADCTLCLLKHVRTQCTNLGLNGPREGSEPARAVQMVKNAMELNRLFVPILNSGKALET